MPDVDVTENYIRLRQREPSEFQDGSMRTIVLDKSGGVHAVIGKIKGKSTTTVQSYLFEKDKWTPPRAEAWVKKHKGGHQAKEWSDRMGGYPGNPDLRVKVVGQFIMLSAGTVDESVKAMVETKGDAWPLFAKGAPKEPPTEFLIVPRPVWKTSKYGDIKVTDRSVAAVMEQYADHGQPERVIDYEHQTFKTADNGQPAPAAGWFRMESRDDGIWAIGVRWTEKAAEMIRSGEYEHFSPTGEMDPDTSELLSITTLALTNYPASKEQKPLVADGKPADVPLTHNEETEMTEQMKKALGLAADATDEECLAAITALVAQGEEGKASLATKDAEIAELKKPDPFRAKALETVGLKIEAKDEDFLAAVMTLKAKAPEAEKVVELQAKVADLETFREKVRIERLMASVSDYVTPANTVDVEALAKALPEPLFLSTVKCWPKVLGGPATQPSQVPAEMPILTKDDEEYLARHGIEKGSDRWRAFEAVRKNEKK